VIGSPALCVEKLGLIGELGIEYVIFFSNMGGLAHSQITESMQRFAADVMPEFRAN
jgi:hypothetical protein